MMESSVLVIETLSYFDILSTDWRTWSSRLSECSVTGNDVQTCPVTNPSSWPLRGFSESKSITLEMRLAFISVRTFSLIRKPSLITESRYIIFDLMKWRISWVLIDRITIVSKL
jgi:hypothetical protein